MWILPQPFKDQGSTARVSLSVLVCKVIGCVGWLVIMLCWWCHSTPFIQEKAETFFVCLILLEVCAVWSHDHSLVQACWASPDVGTFTQTTQQQSWYTSHTCPLSAVGVWLYCFTLKLKRPPRAKMSSRGNCTLCSRQLCTMWNTDFFFFWKKLNKHSREQWAYRL